MEERAAKFKKYIEQLPRLCSPTICGTLSQPLTKAERTNKSPQFEWSLEQKAILSPANITTATCSDIGEVDPSFLHQEAEQFFSQKTIAPSPMTTPSTRTYSRSQPAPNRLYEYMFDEREEDTEEEDNAEDDDDDENESNSDTDIDMDALDETKNNQSDTETEDMTDDEGHKSEQADEEDDDGEDGIDHDHEGEDDDDNDEDDAAMQSGAGGGQDMDSLFLSPPLRSSQTQQRIIFSPETFDRSMEDETTLQSTPKINGSQVFRTRTRRGSDMSD